MVTKSNIYHYFSYVIFALVFFCSIGLYSVSIVEASGSADYFVPMIIRYVIVIAAIIVLIFGYRTLINYLPDKLKIIDVPNVPKIMESFMLLIDILLVMLIRFISETSKLGTEFNSEYLDFALGKTNELSTNGMLGYIYGNICKLLVNIHPSAYPIFVFNTLLQIGIILLTYFTLKKALRMRYAILTVIALSFMPMFWDLIENINPDTFITFLFSLYIFFLVRICIANKTNKIEGNIGILFFVILGLGAGFIASLDIIGISLLFITIPSLLLITNPDPWVNIQRGWFQSLIFTGAFIAGLFASLYLINVNGLANFENVMNYVYSFVPTGLNVDIIAPMVARQEGIAILIFAGIAIFAFLRNELDRGLYYILFIDFAAVFTFVQFNNITYSYFVNYSWVIVAVIGLFSIPSFVLSKEEKEKEVAKKKEKNNKKFRKEQEKFLSNKDGSVISLNNTNEPTKEIKQDNPVESKDAKLENKTVEPSTTVIPASNLKQDKLKEKEAKRKAKEIAKLDKKLNKKDKKNNSIDLSNNIPNTVSEPEKPVSVVDKPVINETVNKPILEEVENIKLEPVKVDPVYPEEIDRSKIIPSRKEYKTAHVYKSEEDKLKHDEKVNAPIVNQNAELKDKPAMIKNVLPGPKPHVAKELSFDYELSESELDYDIKDLKGQDYYDI